MHGARRRVVGCMTGTSLDGLDACVVEVVGRGLGMRARFVRGVSRDLGDVGEGLRRLAGGGAMTAGEIAWLMREFALRHAAAANEALAGAAADLACVHGQTVYHRPPLSWQVMQPAPLARALGCPVVCDLRQADLAAGGQGAPITPLADAVWMRSLGVCGAWRVANLGGFCNVTLGAVGEGGGEDGGGVVETFRLRARDVCACNQVLDEVARRALGRAYDEGGSAALAGTPHGAAGRALGEVLAAQVGSGRSLGTGDEVGAWVARWAGEVSGRDLAATACEALGRAIAMGAEGAGPLLLAGGGVRNAALVAAIRSGARGEVKAMDEVGLPGAYREAACFAVLGALSMDGVAITLPAVTGVEGAAPVSGLRTLA